MIIYSVESLEFGFLPLTKDFLGYFESICLFYLFLLDSVNVRFCCYLFAILIHSR